MAVADGENVGYDVFLIETMITQKGATTWKDLTLPHECMESL